VSTVGLGTRSVPPTSNLRPEMDRQRPDGARLARSVLVKAGTRRSSTSLFQPAMPGTDTDVFVLSLEWLSPGPILSPSCTRVPRIQASPSPRRDLWVLPGHPERPEGPQGISGSEQPESREQGP
jgi:hypothetical protein